MVTRSAAPLSSGNWRCTNPFPKLVSPTTSPLSRSCTAPETISAALAEPLLIKIINEKSKLPLLLFPGSFNQITPQIKTVLYLNLISGRNPKYLIEEHVKGAMKIQKYSIFTVPTAYILLDGGNTTSVQKVSKTEPLNMSDTELVLSHALAGQYLGNKLIYFDCGSGAKKSMMPSLVKYISDNVNIPIMIGGGIKSKETIDKLIESGASYVIIGNFLESSKSDKLFN